MIGDTQIIRMGAPDYTTFKVLAFDIYGTLIDWKSSILQASLGHSIPSAPGAQQTLKLFRKHEREIQATSPTMAYRDIVRLAEARARAEFLNTKPNELGPCENPGVNLDPGKWNAFVDSVEAATRLKKYFKIVAYSNIDRQSWESTVAGPLKGLEFDAAYIAEDIGCYKPDPKFLKYLRDHAKADFGATQNDILTVAHGLEMNHVPAKEKGMPPGVWIMRGDDMRAAKQWGDKIELGQMFETLKDFADAVELQFEGKGKVEKPSLEQVKPHVPEVLKVLEDKGLGGS